MLAAAVIVTILTNIQITIVVVIIINGTQLSGREKPKAYGFRAENTTLVYEQCTECTEGASLQEGDTRLGWAVLACSGHKSSILSVLKCAGVVFATKRRPVFCTTFKSPAGQKCIKVRLRIELRMTHTCTHNILLTRF